MHPAIVRNLILPVHEAVLRRPTLRYLRQLENSQWWTVDALRDLQTRKLRRLLRHAIANSPFFSTRLRDAAIDVDTATIVDLMRLPLLTKATLRESMNEICVPQVPGGLTAAATGGSTGEPLSFRMCRQRQAADQAARARTRRWFGIEPGDRELYLWGSPIERRKTDRIKGLRDRLTNHVLLDAFDLSPQSMDEYLNVLRSFDPMHVFGYPSSLATWSRHVAGCGGLPTPSYSKGPGARYAALKTPSMKAVFTTGEVLSPEDRISIEAAAGVPVADGYGSREGGFVAQQCPRGSYHVTMESVIVELIDECGNAVRDGESGEIVLTHLDGFGMPLIRYRTGDLARRRAAPCECGRGLECLERIEGRVTDALRRSDGGSAHALTAIYVLRESPGVRQFRITQRPDLSLDVDVVADSEFDEVRQRRAGALLRDRLGGNIDVRLTLVTRIPASPSGKHRHVVSQAT